MGESDRVPALDPDAILVRFGAPLDAAMRAAMPDSRRSPLFAMLDYHMGWTDQTGRPIEGHGGKRLRPSLLLLAAEAAGGDPAVAMPAAAAVELLHNFSLIHDDIQDRSVERRHRPVVWAIWGIEQAINAGDALHAIAARAMLRSVEAGASPAATIEVSTLLHDACLSLVDGQYRDLSFESRDDVTPDEYFHMIDGKTGALLTASVEIGAVLGGGGARRIEWRGFGANLGRAFQIVDDVLGVWGDSRVTGKPLADDVVRGKRSLPFLSARTRLPDADARRLTALYNLPERDDRAVAEAIELMDRSGARAAAEAAARDHLTAALAALDRAGARATGGDELRRLARFVVERDR